MNEGRVKMALVGAGRWGTNVARELASAGSLAAIVSRTPTEPFVRDSAASWDVPAMTLAELCSATDIPATWATIPTIAHEAVARQLLAANKHLLLEKPATGDARVARELADLATERRVVFATGYVFLYHPVYRELKKRLASATITGVTCVWKKYGTFSEPIELNLFTHHLSLALDLFGSPTNGTVHISINGNVLEAGLAYDGFSFSSHIDRESGEKTHTIDFALADDSVYRWDNQKLLLRAPGASNFSVAFESAETALHAEVRVFLSAVAKNDSSEIPSSGDFGARVLEEYAALIKDR